MPRIFAGVGILYLMIIIGCSVGWVMNIISLVNLAHQTHPNLVMAGIRIVCAFTFFPAGIMGWIPN